MHLYIRPILCNVLRFANERIIPKPIYWWWCWHAAQLHWIRSNGACSSLLHSKVANSEVHLARGDIWTIRVRHLNTDCPQHRGSGVDGTSVIQPVRHACPAGCMFCLRSFLFLNNHFRQVISGSTWPIFTKFSPGNRHDRRLLIWPFSDRSRDVGTDVAMATNFRVKIGEIGRLAFIRRPGIPKRLEISPFWF